MLPRGQLLVDIKVIGSESFLPFFVCATGQLAPVFVTYDATHPPRLLLPPGAGRNRPSHSSRFVRVQSWAVSVIHAIFTPISDYSQPTEVQNAIKAIFEERTKFV